MTELDRIRLNADYKAIVNPKNLLKGMNESDFKEWLLDGTLKDLKCTLEVLEDAEMFEHAIIVRDMINHLN